MKTIDISDMIEDYSGSYRRAVEALYETPQAIRRRIKLCSSFTDGTSKEVNSFKIEEDF